MPLSSVGTFKRVWGDGEPKNHEFRLSKWPGKPSEGENLIIEADVMTKTFGIETPTDILVKQEEIPEIFMTSNADHKPIKPKFSIKDAVDLIRSRASVLNITPDMFVDYMWMHPNDIKRIKAILKIRELQEKSKPRVNA